MTENQKPEPLSDEQIASVAEYAERQSSMIWQKAARIARELQQRRAAPCHHRAITCRPCELCELERRAAPEPLETHDPEFGQHLASMLTPREPDEPCAVDIQPAPAQGQAPLGIEVKLDPSMPRDVVELRQGDRVVATFKEPAQGQAALVRDLTAVLAETGCNCAEARRVLAAHVAAQPQALVREDVESARYFTPDQAREVLATIDASPSAPGVTPASEILAWLNTEQKRADRWVRYESGMLRFALTSPELMRIRAALATQALVREDVALALTELLRRVEEVGVREHTDLAEAVAHSRAALARLSQAQEALRAQIEALPEYAPEPFGARMGRRSNGGWLYKADVLRLLPE